MKQKINSTINQMRLNRLQKTLRKINNYSEMMKSYSDEQLQDKTKTFQQQLANHQATLDDLLPEAYAVVREASWRVLGMYPKDVQVLGAITLHEGDIAEMQTGEGKTLTATMPLYLNALTKKGAYLIIIKYAPFLVSAFKYSGIVAVSVFPSPVCISAISPSCNVIAPKTWTSLGYIPKTRQLASRTTAYASGNKSSNVA